MDADTAISDLAGAVIAQNALLGALCQVLAENPELAAPLASRLELLLPAMKNNYARSTVQGWLLELRRSAPGASRRKK